MGAAGQIPVGVKSGRAIRAADDQQAQRFQNFANGYQQLVLDVTDLDIELAREIYERDGEFEVTVPGAKFLDTLDWGDIDMARDEYEMKTWPSNLLPDSPSEKLETVTEMAQNGQIPPEAVNDLLDYPDLESAMGPINGPTELIKMQLSQMLDDGEDVQPEDYQPPALAMKMASDSLQYAQTRGCPEKNLAKVRNYMTSVAAMMPPPPPPPTPPIGQPLGVPGKPPVADMLPTMPPAGGPPA
jgi:hypothetical protein